MFENKLREETKIKLERLRADLSGFESLLVCYSGGTDSALLAAVAKEQLGMKAEAVLFQSVLIPQKMLAEARQQAVHIGINLHLIEVDVLGNPALVNNPENRCYICKQHLLSLASALADERGIKAVAEGSQADDLRKHRPGRAAVRKAGAYSPLEKAELGKQEIREISRVMGLPCWAQPSYSCLMTRFPYDEHITAEKLKGIEEAEEFLKQLGFKYCKARHHGELVRLGLGVNESVAALGQYKEKIFEYFKKLNYKDVVVDIEET